MSALRRHASPVVAGALVLVLGLLVMLAGRSAADRAIETHRADRLVLQETLAGLTDQYVRLSAVEVADAVGASPGSDAPPWSSRVDDPASVARLEELVRSTRALDAGALLVDATGSRLAGWSVSGRLPVSDDPGWAPLRAAVLGGDGVLPVSGVLDATGTPLLAFGLPVQLAEGGRALLIGLWKVRTSPLQSYVADLAYGRTGHGFVLDGAGVVIAGDLAVDGQAVQMVLQAVTSARRGGGGDKGPALLESGDGGRARLATYANVGGTSWAAVTVQDKVEFEGPLVRAGHRVQVLIAGLLVLVLVVLVVLHRRRMREAQDHARTDELTGLLNRRGWMLRAGLELERANRQQARRNLLFLDLDGLKSINDTLGHREGDRALVAAADVLRAVSGPEDIVGRLGGDEFVVLATRDAGTVLEHLQAVLQSRNDASSDAFEVRISVGVQAWVPAEKQTLDELVRTADDAMYQNKLSRMQRAEGVVRLPRQRQVTREPSLPQQPSRRGLRR